MATYIGNITSIITAAVGWMGTAGEAIAANPLALLFILLPMMGAGIGLFRRIIHLN
jgi:hypothetical protein